MTTNGSAANTAHQHSDMMSFCRTCGGDRHHTVLYQKTISWTEDDSGLDGGDMWLVLQCAGCHTIAFAHQHWFSEEHEIDETERKQIVHLDLYPPSPRHQQPKWGINLYLGLRSDERWINQMLNDIYSAAGMKARSLAAMGARAIVDYLITSRAGDKGSFSEKLHLLEEQGVITKIQVDLANAAFDAGSAAAHRGYNPSEDDLNILLEITESLLQQICVNRVQAARQIRAAERLRESTPKRAPRQRS